jgi:hypothetical protein
LARKEKLPTRALGAMAAVVAALGATFDDTDRYVVESINAESPIYIGV